MKLTLIIVFISVLGLLNTKESLEDFDYKLSEIAQNFREKIMDKDECENLKREAEDLVDDIEKAKDDVYTYEEKKELGRLKKEAEALVDYIASVGDCGNYIPSIKDFNLANQRVRANISYVVKDKYCVDVITVSIGDYVAYLVENNSSKNYTLSYKWKSQNGMSSGNGNMGISKKGLRHFYNNRDENSQKMIFVLGITCKEI